MLLSSWLPNTYTLMFNRHLTLDMPPVKVCDFPFSRDAPLLVVFISANGSFILKAEPSLTPLLYHNLHATYSKSLSSHTYGICLMLTMSSPVPYQKPSSSTCIRPSSNGFLMGPPASALPNTQSSPTVYSQ